MLERARSLGASIKPRRRQQGHRRGGCPPHGVECHRKRGSTASSTSKLGKDAMLKKGSSHSVFYSNET
eukprot:scaffold3941_cov78-Skeletonema_dohrnii-CCMP3373.AAC.5